MLLTVYGTEWPILCWCAVKKLLTHYMQWQNCKLTVTDSDLLLETLTIHCIIVCITRVHHITCYVKTFDAAWSVGPGLEKSLVYIIGNIAFNCYTMTLVVTKNHS